MSSGSGEVSSEMTETNIFCIVSLWLLLLHWPLLKSAQATGDLRESQDITSFSRLSSKLSLFFR